MLSFVIKKHEFVYAHVDIVCSTLYILHSCTLFPCFFSNHLPCLHFIDMHTAIELMTPHRANYFHFRPITVHFLNLNSVMTFLAANECFHIYMVRVLIIECLVMCYVLTMHKGAWSNCLAGDLLPFSLTCRFSKWFVNPYDRFCFFRRFVSLKVHECSEGSYFEMKVSEYYGPIAKEVSEIMKLRNYEH